MASKAEIRRLILKAAENKKDDYWIFRHGIRISKPVIDYLADYKGAHTLNEIIDKTLYITFHSARKTLKIRDVENAVYFLDNEAQESESQALDEMERGIVECETAYEEDSDYFLSVRGF